MNYADAEEYLLHRAELPETTPDTKRRFTEQHASGVINPIILSRLLSIRAQMVYNYIRKGRIPTILDDTQHMVIKWPDAVEFTAVFVGRKAAQQAKIEAQLRGERV